jgi:hypothetical protein
MNDYRQLYEDNDEKISEDIFDMDGKNLRKSILKSMKQIELEIEELLISSKFSGQRQLEKHDELIKTLFLSQIYHTDC